MSSSSPISIRRLPSSTSSAHSNKEQEELINAYEAEEERITNVLSRRLEQVRVEKIQVENVLEAESEARVNRLNRELALLRTAQQQNGEGTGAVNGSGNDPSTQVILDALQRENEQLRSRLTDIERDYIRMSRLNEIYREELIDHRNRLGQPVDNLIGMSSSTDPYSQPTHHRSLSSSSSVSSISSMYKANGVPIPRPQSQIRRPQNNISESNTPLSHSPTSPSVSGSSISASPYAFSLSPGGPPESLMSNLTTPPSSASLHNYQYGGPLTGARALSYPSVPPPSLSSSFVGSPTVPYHMGHRDRDPSLSPVEPLSRRNSTSHSGQGPRGNWRVAESGNLRSISATRSHSRRESLERGARVAETGSLALARSRAGSHSQTHSTSTSMLPSTSEDVNDVNLVDDETVFA